MHQWGGTWRREGGGGGCGGGGVGRQAKQLRDNECQTQLEHRDETSPAEGGRRRGGREEESGIHIRESDRDTVKNEGRIDIECLLP